MKQVLVMVRYRLDGNTGQFRTDMETAAAALGATPDLIWKIWALDAGSGTGLSAYLFETTAAADAFVAGPTLERLRAHPVVQEVAVDRAPVDPDLSALTGAGPALAVRHLAAQQFTPVA